MNFIKKLEKLKALYENDRIVRKNGTLLMSPGKIPNCRHMMFAPLTDDIIDEYLVSQYKFKIPDSYLEILRYSNGVDLFWIKIVTSKFCFASSLLTIYGLPLKHPLSDIDDGEEPYDIRIEDLATHNSLPRNWLKIGNYSVDTNIKATYDIFVDTDSEKVYSCERRKKEIFQSWSSIDECLCSIFDNCEKAPTTYNVNS